MKSFEKRQIAHTSLVTVLYVRNLSSKTTEDQLHVIFSMGCVLKLEKVKKLRDFAFIHYCKREDAAAALERFNGMFLDGCVLEVTWAKPPEFQKQKMLMEKCHAACLYRQANFDNLDHSFDLGMHPNSSTNRFSFFPRSNARQRLPMSNLSNLPNSFAFTRPVQLLGYLCSENSWGNPLYQLSQIDSDPSEMFYICWIIIPNIPAQARRFMSDKVCHSPEEAKHYAACYVLKKLGVIDCDFPYIGSPHSLPMQNSLSNVSKSYLSANHSSSVPKPAPSSFGLCSPLKDTTSFQSLKSPISPPHPYFFERGQGDAGSFLNSPSMDSFNADDTENGSPLFDTNIPIEPTSILGLLSSLAAASNDLSLFNSKPKL